MVSIVANANTYISLIIIQFKLHCIALYNNGIIRLNYRDYYI